MVMEILGVAKVQLRLLTHHLRWLGLYVGICFPLFKIGGVLHSYVHNTQEFTYAEVVAEIQFRKEELKSKYRYSDYLINMRIGI